MRAQRTNLELKKFDWKKIWSLMENLPYPKPCFANKERDKRILNRLRENGNQPLSEQKLIDLSQSNFFLQGQCQVMNQIFNYHKMPYRLLQVEPGFSNNPHFKLFVVRGGRQ